MRFETIERDGLARIGRLELDDRRYTTPAIAFVETERFSAPHGSLRFKMLEKGARGDLLIAPSDFPEHSAARGVEHLSPHYRGSPYADASDDPHVLVPKGTSALMLDSAKFADEVESAKTGTNLLRPLMCSVMGLPHRLALLCYCGFDIFDSLPLIMSSENGGYLTSTGVLQYSKLKDLPCSCPACASGARGKDQLLAHNYSAADIELRMVRHAISEGRLRELVENRVRTDPWLVQNLRLLDVDHKGLMERHAPVKGAPFHAGSKESLSRPEILRWRKRLEERYQKPEGTKILVLIPCSARKPYSFSKSHMRFRQAIQQSGRADLVHEVIVTSPIGLVPRELELFYPAQDYDIPVTGHWDRDEKTLAQDAVSWLVSSHKYDLVISHLGDEREPVNAALKDSVDTSLGSPGSPESLQRLERAIREADVGSDQGPGWSRHVEDMRSICRFQFGSAGEKLCESATTWGRWPNIKIMRGAEQLGMLTGERGMISLTLEGAEIIATSSDYCVEIDDFVPKGNLFAVGVEGADEDIRIGDDVAVVHKGDVRAVGVATMSPEEMILSERGEAVHVRHARA